MATPAAALPAPPQFARIGASLRPLLVLLGIAAAVAVGVTVALWSQGPNWGLLYASLAPQDASAVAQALEAAQIKHKVDATTGAVMVPQDKINDARLKLAAQGLPASDDGGFELIRKDPGFGVSQFMENARYQHALEVELVRTITSLQAVEAARVHLASPAPSAFVRDRRPGSASVFVKLRPGRQLEQEQVNSIVHLVASSIPGLEAAGVTVVDQQGRLLSAPKSPETRAADEQAEAARRIEATYVDRIEQLLAPMVGAGRVRAQVTAELDASAVEMTRESYQPESQVVRSEQLSEQTSSNGNATGGVPGALTNQPPPGGVALPPNTPAPGSAGAAAVAAASAPGANAAAAQAAVPAVPDNVSKQSTRNYEIDRLLSYTRQPAGRIRRLTVAVLVDNVRVTDKDGKETMRPLGAKQLADITALVKDAVGFDTARGDSVNVVNASFIDDAGPLTPETVPLWQQPIMLTVARLLLGAMVAIALLLVIVKPLVRSLTQPKDAHGRAPGIPGGAMPNPNDQLSAPPPAAALPEPAAAGEHAPTSGKSRVAYERQVEIAQQMVSEDPKRVAQVVMNWVNAE